MIVFFEGKSNDSTLHSYNCIFIEDFWNASVPLSCRITSISGSISFGTINENREFSIWLECSRLKDLPNDGTSYFDYGQLGGGHGISVTPLIHIGMHFATTISPMGEHIF